jgi:hypothetical protein
MSVALKVHCIFVGKARFLHTPSPIHPASELGHGCCVGGCEEPPWSVLEEERKKDADVRNPQMRCSQGPVWTDLQLGDSTLQRRDHWRGTHRGGSRSYCVSCPDTGCCATMGCAISLFQNQIPFSFSLLAIPLIAARGHRATASRRRGRWEVGRYVCTMI